MKNNFKGKWLISFLIAFFLVLPTMTYAQKQKIKVVVEGTSIRLQPNMESEIALSPPVGSIFEVENKVGEWYEVKFSSEIGVLITGYIHEMFIEVEKEAVKPKEEVIKKPVKPEPVYQPPTAAPTSRRPWFSIKGGFIFALIPEVYSYEFSFPLYGETATISESVYSDNAFSFEFGLGFFPIRYLEIESTVTVLSKGHSGSYGLDWPSEYFTNLHASDEIESDEMEVYPTFNKTIFCIGLLVHPIVSGPVRVYFGGGGSYVTGNLELAEDISFTETTYFFPPSHEITINEVDFVETDDLEDISLSKFGFYGKAGVNFMVARIFGIYAEGKYIFAKTEIPHPLISSIDPNADEVEINLGGMSFCMGVKLIF